MGLTEIRPLGSKMLVCPLVVPEYFEGPIKVPDTVKDTIPPQQGSIIKTGRKVTAHREGQNILFGLGVGSPYEERGITYLFIDERDVICGIN